MKQLNFFALSGLIFFSIAILSCEGISVNEKGNEEDNNSSNDLKEGQIVLKGYPDENMKMSFWLTAEKVIINWGDGYIDTLNPHGKNMQFVHNYQKYADYKTILVSTERLTRVGPSYQRDGQQLAMENLWDSKTHIGEYHEIVMGPCEELTTKSFYLPEHSLEMIDVGPSLRSLLFMRTNTALTIIGSNLLSISVGSPIGVDISGVGNGLKHLLIYSHLTSLDVSKFTVLTSLDCSNNQLTSLNVSKNTVLTSLDCAENQLTSLDLSKNTALTRVNCQTNQLSASALNALFESLPPDSVNHNDRGIYCGNNPGSRSCDKTIAERKGWFVDVEYYSWWVYRIHDIQPY